MYIVNSSSLSSADFSRGKKREKTGFEPGTLRCVDLFIYTFPSFQKNPAARDEGSSDARLHPEHRRHRILGWIASRQSKPINQAKNTLQGRFEKGFDPKRSNLSPGERVLLKRS